MANRGRAPPGLRRGGGSRFVAGRACESDLYSTRRVCRLGPHPSVTVSSRVQEPAQHDPVAAIRCRTSFAPSIRLRRLSFYEPLVAAFAMRLAIVVSPVAPNGTPPVSISGQRRLRCLALTALGEPLALLFFDRCIPLRVRGSYGGPFCLAVMEYRDIQRCTFLLWTVAVRCP